MPDRRNIFAELDVQASHRRLLRGVLLTIVMVCVVSFVGLVAGSNYTLSRAVFVPIFLGIAGFSYWQLGRSVQRSAAILIIGLWLATTAVTILFAGVHSANLLIYCFLIVLTGWIMGGRWLWGLAASTIALIMALGVLELAGYYHPTPRADVVFVTLTLVSTLVALSFITGVTYSSLTRERDRAFTMAQQLAEQNRIQVVQSQIQVQRERDLKMILDHVPAAIASFDAQSRLRFGNLRYAALFGARPEELVEHNISEYLTPEALAAVSEPWQRCLNGEPAGYRRTIRNPLSGEVRVFDVKLEPEFHQGRVAGLFAHMLDVTEKVAAEVRIQELNETLEGRVQQRTEQLEAALDKLHRSQEELARSETKAALSTLIASVSHELSSPLGNSLMASTTLLEQGKVFYGLVQANRIKRSDLMAFVESVSDGTDLMQRNLQRATDLLDNFRQVANDQASEQPRVFDLATTVREVVDTLAPSLKRQPHKVAIDIPDGITMDSLPGPLGQIIINLTNNAYLHAFEGRDNGVLTISARLDGDSTTLSFTDNGVGIAEDNLRRLFEPFFTTKKGSGGTGLGMGIVENLVHKTLGGSIQVQSTLGTGTRVDMRLPLLVPTAPARV